MRLIDADELLTHIEDFGEGQYSLNLISPYYVRNAPTVNAIPIPDDATNGDMVKIIFPNIKSNEDKGYQIIHWDNLWDDENCAASFVAARKWWEAPYKRGNADGNDN